MKNKKRNTIITCIIVGIILIIGLVVFLLNSSIIDNGLSVLEKKWITDHVNQIIDVKVYNNVPIYGYNGSGINLDFLDYFTEKYKISFNKISYYTKNNQEKIDFGFLILNPEEEMGKNDILFDTDHYAIMAKNKNYHVSLNKIERIGILEEDNDVLKKYFSNKVELVVYKDINSMLESLNKEEITYVSIPMLQFMDKTLSNQLSIVTHLNDLKKQYIFRTTDSTVYEIMRKTYLDYLKKEYEEDYSKNYLSVYFNSTNTKDAARKSYNSKVYRYGYVVNMPFENNIDNEFVGTISNYLLNFEKISYSEIDTVKYHSIDDLKSALVSGEIDFALTNFDYEKINLKYTTTNTIRNLEYLVLSKKNLVINSIQGLKREKVSVVAGSLLHRLCSEYNIKVKTFSDTNELLRSIDDDSIILLDQETYQYYKDEKLQEYHILLRESIENGYKFILNSNNETFNGIFRYYVDSIDYNSLAYQYRTNVGINKDYTSLKVIIFTIVLISFLIASIWFINHKSITNVVPKKDERLKYIDPMTSLKNRTYLNKNIYTWDDNVIFPQGIIVFDLNQIKRVNDKFGREAGDEIIRKAASILINQQLENTDIIRSDGDEFIIYMVGYNEEKVSEYMHKLEKMINDIPKCLGTAAGYSMIFDEVKTVDDAINEAILMMMKNKEQK